MSEVGGYVWLGVLKSGYVGRFISGHFCRYFVVEMQVDFRLDA